jgi:hypothetical protein
MRIPKVVMCLAVLGIFGLPLASQAENVYPNGWAYIHPGTQAQEPVPPPQPAGDYLLDNGVSPPYNSGWAVSGANMAFGGFTQFQKFTVTDAEGWDITTIGVDGFYTLDPAGLGFTGTVLPDVGGAPDEDNPVASAVYFLGQDINNSDWRDVEFDIILAQGDYWFRAEANDADYSGTWRNGLTGDTAFSRRNSDGAEFTHSPLAFRIAGEVVPEPSAIALLLLGAGTLLRRR